MRSLLLFFADLFLAGLRCGGGKAEKVTEKSAAEQQVQIKLPSGFQLEGFGARDEIINFYTSKFGEPTKKVDYAEMDMWCKDTLLKG